MSQNHSETANMRMMPPGLKAIMVVALVTICCAGIRSVSAFFAPAFLSLTLVLTVRPIHRWLVRKGMPRPISAALTIAVLLGVLLSLVGLMVWSLTDLPSTIASYSDSFNELVQNLLRLAEEHNISTENLTSNILDNLDYDKIVTAVSVAVDYLTSAGTLLGIMALAIFFITVDTMSMEVRSRISIEHDAHLHDALSGFESRVRQYWMVSSTFGAVVAVINGIVLVFLEVPLPWAWAMFSFITNYIPNIGFVIGVIPPALLGLLDSGWVTAVIVIAAYSIINAGIQGLLQPKITGDAVGLSTTVTFLSLLFWTVIIGPMGSILAVPLTLFSKALLVDSSPQTRWLNVFLVPESEAKKRYEAGYYDEENPADDDFVDFLSAELGERQELRATLQKIRQRRSDSGGRGATRISTAIRHVSSKRNGGASAPAGDEAEAVDPASASASESAPDSASTPDNVSTADSASTPESVSGPVGAVSSAGNDVIPSDAPAARAADGEIVDQS